MMKTDSKSSGGSSSSSSSSGGAPLTLNVFAAMVLWIVGTTGGCVYLLLTLNADTVDLTQIRWGLVLSILFFNNLNILISFIEISLGTQIALIKEDSKKAQEKYTPNNQHFQAIVAYLFLPLPWDRLLDGRLWCRMWSAYTVYDPSYQNDESFGFFIDVGNGWSTIPSCVLMNLAICFPRICSPLVVGCICLASYWQIQYGTIIYFLSFIWNKRYEGKNLGETMAFVGISNGIWLIFPLACIYACVSMLDTKDFSVFGHYS